jgi:hypothetical protein
MRMTRVREKLGFTTMAICSFLWSASPAMSQAGPPLPASLQAHFGLDEFADLLRPSVGTADQYSQARLSFDTTGQSIVLDWDSRPAARRETGNWTRLPCLISQRPYANIPPSAVSFTLLDTFKEPTR